MFDDNAKGHIRALLYAVIFEHDPIESVDRILDPPSFSLNAYIVTLSLSKGAPPSAHGAWGADDLNTCAGLDRRFPFSCCAPLLNNHHRRRAAAEFVWAIDHVRFGSRPCERTWGYRAG